MQHILAPPRRELAASIPIQCLAVMSLAQGLCTNLMEFAWKSHIRLLYHNPADFTAFLGEVAAWQVSAHAWEQTEGAKHADTSARHLQAL